MKHTEHPKPNAPLEAHNMKEMTIRNSVEKLECEKRQKIIEKQRSYFVRQHSRDENEIKQILLRLQQEQETIHDDAEGSPLSTGNETREGSSCERDRSATDPGVEGEEVVNPYPLVIVPKYGSPTPLKNRVETDSPTRSLRRCDRNDSPNKSSSFRATVIAASFINKLHAPIAARKGGKSPFLEGDDALWVGDLEYIHSIRRPRKSVADMNHQRTIFRAKSDVHRIDASTPSSNFGSMVSLRGESPRFRHRDDFEELHGLPIVAHEHNGESVSTQETEVSPKLIRKTSRDKKGCEKQRKVSSSTVDLRKPLTVETEIKKSPRLLRKGSLENKTKVKSGVERSHSFHHAPKCRQEVTKPGNVNTTKPDSVDSPKSTKEDIVEKPHKRKSSLKKKKDDSGTVAEKPKKISFADLDDSIPQRTRSLRERKTAMSGRPRSSSTGST